MIESDQQKIYFSGDSGYEQKFFQELRRRFNAIDVALLPLGAYEPRWFMKTHHMNPEEAVQVHLDINAKHSIGMHFGTFHLSDEMWGQPEKDLLEAKKKLSVENFTTLDVGQTKVF